MPRPKLDRPPIHGEAARGAFGLDLIVAAALQIIRELARGQGLANENSHWGGVNPRRGLERPTREAPIDHAPEGEVVVGEEAYAGEQQESGEREEREAQAG